MIFLDNMVPIAFHPYTSVVCDRILELDYKHGDCVDNLSRALIDMFRAAAIKCELDNKIVFEFLDNDTNQKVFIGFYDWRFAVGHSFRGNL